MHVKFHLSTINNNQYRSMNNPYGYFRSIITSQEVGQFLKDRSGMADGLVTEFVKVAKSTGELSSTHLKIY